jgi:hypothetical protein
MSPRCRLSDEGGVFISETAVNAKTPRGKGARDKEMAKKRPV